MKLDNIRKTYHNKNNTVEALKGISLDLSDNGITVILGPSGCGKTTLMNIIAGRLSYEGTISDIPNFDYLTQDFNLFENMSVLDNLTFVSKNMKRINSLLDEFEMSEFKNRKVKKLSNGQKKRVQFIRALLHKPGLLLCDEPTAALDHDNTVTLMKELKKLSSSIQIILVTHDIALAEEYADRIITMDQGTVVKDEVIHECSKATSGKSIKHHALKSTFTFSLKRLSSQIADSLSSVLLSVLCILTCFGVVNLRNNVSSQSDYASTFKNAENMIVSVPHETVKEGMNSSFTGYYRLYTGLTVDDYFKYTDVKKVVEEHPEIIGVESFNSAQYKQDTDLEYAKIDSDLNAFYSVQITNRNQDYASVLNQPIFPLEIPFIIKNDYSPALDDEDQGFYVSNYYTPYRIQAFDLTNNYQDLPLLCGTLPTNDDVILSKTAADMYMEINGYSSYEEIIDKPIKIGIRGYNNSYKLYDNDPTYTYEYEKGEPEGYYFDTININIAAVSSVENDFCSMIFFNCGFGNNPIYKHYVKDLDYVSFQYVRFLTEPGTDYEALAEEINKEFNKPNVTIMQYKGQGLGKERKFYQSPAGFMIYGVVILVLLILLVLVRFFFKRKQLKKESQLLSTYGYSPVMESILRNGVLLLLSMIITVLICSPLSTYINNFAKEHYYQPFLTTDIILLLLVTVIYGIIIVITDNLISSGGERK